MCGHAVKLALAACLTLVGAACAEEHDPITTGSMSPAMSFSELDLEGELGATDLVRAVFGFSPFLEEGLISEVPQVRYYEFLMPVPAYLRDLREVVD